MPLLKAVKDKFNAARNSEFLEDTKKVVPNDSGSTVLGFSAAFLGLDLYRASGPAKSPLPFPLLVAAIPLLDASLAVVRRLRHRRSPFEGDRRQFYGLLLARGWTARNVALTCYGSTAGLAVAGWITIRAGFSQALFAFGLILGGLLVTAVRMGSLRAGENAWNHSVRSKMQLHWLSARRARQRI